VWIHSPASSVTTEGGVMGDKGYVEAVKWYRKAAEQNYAEAQSNLGLCYEKGQGRCPKTVSLKSTATRRTCRRKRRRRR